MSNNDNILLCDIGGTHARFARLVKAGEYDNFRKYHLKSFDDFPHIISTYIKESELTFSSARFAAAKTPVNGIISYKRTSHDPDYEINFPVIREHFKWDNLLHLDDMQPALMGAIYLNNNKPDQLSTVIEAREAAWNANTILLSIGTGLGYAHAKDGEPFCTPGGHILPLTVTAEHREVEAFIRSHKDPSQSLIMEDFVSLGGLKMIDSFVNGKIDTDPSVENFMARLNETPNVSRLFFEFFGLYAHMVTCCTGFYGGMFLTGGVLDHLIKHDLADWDAFKTYFSPPMLPVVNARLNSVSVHYLTHDEMPLLGLTTI